MSSQDPRQSEVAWPDAVEPDLRTHWTLDAEVAFLNHGSFGATPRVVLEQQAELRARMERQPVQFFVRDLEPMLDEARKTLARFVGARADDLVFVPNVTTAFNAVVRTLPLSPGDELLTTSHGYNACSTAMQFVAERTGAVVKVAEVPFPVRSDDEVISAVLAAVGPRTRLAVIDHITSPTGLVLPIARLVEELELRGVDTFVDGAHAPGMVDVDVSAIGAAFYGANCHKWICAPKGAGFLVVRPDKQEQVRPLCISHGANSPRRDRSRYRLEFDWVGTDDPTPYLCVPRAIELMDSLLPGGWDAVRARNRALVLAGRALISQVLDVPSPCPDAMIGSLAALPLPDGAPEVPTSSLYADPLQDDILRHSSVEVPVVPWPAPPKRLIRLSAQLYNRREDYERLAGAMRDLL
ncbi:MAG: aminotransferase class V-fold PLP-dependent enzyme [Myxococcota bacterium]